MPRAFALVRLFALVALTIFSLITLGLGASLCTGGTWNIDVGDGVTVGLIVMSPTASGLAVAISVITLVIVGPSLAFAARLLNTVQWLKFLSLVWVELSWTSVLCILWLGTAGLTTSFSVTTAFDLGNIYGIGDCNNGACSASRALKAFSWLNFFIFFGYMTALTACAVVSVRRGTGKFLSMDVDQILSPRDATPVELEAAEKV